MTRRRLEQELVFCEFLMGGLLYRLTFVGPQLQAKQIQSSPRAVRRLQQAMRGGDELFGTFAFSAGRETC